MRRYRVAAGCGLAVLAAVAVLLAVFWDELGSDGSDDAAPEPPPPLVDFRGRAEAPEGRFVDISASWRGTCGVRVGGALECWGNWPGWSEGLPSGRFVAVSLGGFHVCAIAVDASVLCWGDNESGQADAPAGGFVDVSVSHAGSCGVRAGGSLVCWGDGSYGHLEVPQQGMFTKVFAVPGCALRADGEYVCWAQAHEREARWAAVPAGRFVELSLGESYGCARREDGSVLCWRLGSSPKEPTSGGVVWPDRVQLPVEDFVSVSVGRKGGERSYEGDVERVCGLRAAGSVLCWPLYSYGAGSKEHAEQVVADAKMLEATNAAGVTDPFAGPYVDLAISYNGQCGLRADGSALCWGGSVASSAAHLGEVSDIAADFNACGIDPQGAIVCSARHDDWTLAPPAGAFTEIVALGGYGRERMCGLREDHKILCWASPDGHVGTDFGSFYTPDGELHVPEERYGEPFVAEGEFMELSTQGAGVCGLRADATAVCWGGSPLELRSPPGGEFTQVAPGFGRPCGIRPNGRIECWRYDGLGQPAPSVGPLTDAANGCGIRPDSTMVCWDGRTGSELPNAHMELNFGSVHGYASIHGESPGYPCGIRTNGTVRCRGAHGDPPAGSGPFTKAAPGDNHACGIRTDKTVMCWGHNLDPPIANPMTCASEC